MLEGLSWPGSPSQATDHVQVWSCKVSLDGLGLGQTQSRRRQGMRWSRTLSAQVLALMILAPRLLSRLQVHLDNPLALLLWCLLVLLDTLLTLLLFVGISGPLKLLLVLRRNQGRLLF